MIPSPTEGGGGMTQVIYAIDIIEHLARQHRDAIELRLFQPRFPGLVQDRVPLTNRELTLVQNAVDWRAATHTPFWDSLLLQAETEPVPPVNLLDAVRFHNPQSQTAFSIPIDEHLAVRLRGACGPLPEDEAVVVSSAMRFRGGSTYHIPMLDFHCVASESTERLVRQVAIRIWPQGGYLVASGKSYHFYGNGLLTDCELVTFLATSLLYGPVVDRAWVAHQLLERACGLRISHRATYPFPPFLVGRIDPEA